MSKKAHIRYVDCGMLPISLGFTKDVYKFKKEMARYGFEEHQLFCEDGIATTHTIKNDSGHIAVIVCLQKKVHKHSLPSVCAHEAVHVAQSALDAMHEENPGEETRAYIVQWVTELLYEAFRK